MEVVRGTLAYGMKRVMPRSSAATGRMQGTMKVRMAVCQREQWQAHTAPVHAGS